MDYIAQNPYRVLGVLANDSLKIRTANTARICAFNKVGKNCDFNCDFTDIFGIIDRTDDSIERAIKCLSSEEDSAFYSLLWLHRTSKLPLPPCAAADIISSSIPCETFDDTINTIIGSLYAQNYALAANSVTHLFNFENILSSHIQRRFLRYVLNYFNELSLSQWWPLFLNACLHENDKDSTTKFIVDFFNELSLEELRKTNSDTTLNKDYPNWQELNNIHTKSKLLIEVIKESSDLETKSPNAESQLVLSEYANSMLQACKRYYTSTRFWEAKPIWEIIVVLRELYKISYSSKVKDECINFGVKLRQETIYYAPEEVHEQSSLIKKIIQDFCEKPNETRWSLNLLENCVAPLIEIKSTLGSDNPYYLRISTQIADNALFACDNELETAREECSNPDNEKEVAFNHFKEVLQQSVQLCANIEVLDLESSFAGAKLKKFTDTVNSLCEKHDETPVNLTQASISLGTTDDIFQKCKDYQSLTQYIIDHPSGPHLIEAKKRIWEIEDNAYPKDVTAQSLLAYKKMYPNSHNDKKVLDALNSLLLGVRNGTISEYRSFLKLYPAHERKNEILSRLDLVSFKACKYSDDFKNYLRNFPNGQYCKDVRAKMQEWSESAIKVRFILCKSLLDYNKFILQYPSSPLSLKAYDKIEDAIYDKVSKSGNYDDYHKRYPHGRYIHKLNDLADEKEFQKCKVVADFEKYIQNNPHGKFVRVATELIQKKRRHILINWIFGILAVLILVLICVAIGNGSKDTNTSNQAIADSTAVKQNNNSTLTEIDVDSMTFDDDITEDYVTYIIATADGEKHQVSEHNIKKYGINAYIKAYEGAMMMMRDSSGNDYGVPLNQYNEAKNIDGLRPFIIKHYALNKNNQSEKYRNNSLKTGAKPYSSFFGRAKTGKNYLNFKTSKGNDYVVTVKRHSDNRYINHIYIHGGDDARMYVPNGTFDVYFYSGSGWNPKKETGLFIGGFVDGGNTQKDESVKLDNSYLEYTLYRVENGNLLLEGADENDVFK